MPTPGTPSSSVPACPRWLLTYPGTVALAQGNRSFPSFAAMLAATVAAAPHRDRESLWRRVFHNARRLDDGTWRWRYDSIRKKDGFEKLWGRRASADHPHHVGPGSELLPRQRRRRGVRPDRAQFSAQPTSSRTPGTTERPAARVDRHPARATAQPTSRYRRFTRSRCSAHHPAVAFGGSQSAAATGIPSKRNLLRWRLYR